jgi:signal transduction histidine kinase
MCQARRTGAIELSAAREHDRVVLRVCDQGPGLATGVRRARGGKGRGLGADLRLAREIVSRHGATFEGHNRIPEGAEFVIRFPVPEDASSTRTRVDGPAPPAAVAQPSSAAPAT